MNDACIRRTLHMPWLIAGTMVFCCVFWTFPAYAENASESARQIPVAYRVDVVVMGGSSAAVAAAEPPSEAAAAAPMAAVAANYKEIDEFRTTFRCSAY